MAGAGKARALRTLRGDVRRPRAADPGKGAADWSGSDGRGCRQREGREGQSVDPRDGQQDRQARSVWSADDEPGRRTDERRRPDHRPHAVPAVRRSDSQSRRHRGRRVGQGRCRLQPPARREAEGRLRRRRQRHRLRFRRQARLARPAQVEVALRRRHQVDARAAPGRGGRDRALGLLLAPDPQPRWDVQPAGTREEVRRAI